MLLLNCRRDVGQIATQSCAALQRWVTWTDDAQNYSLAAAKDQRKRANAYGPGSMAEGPLSIVAVSISAEPAARVHPRWPCPVLRKRLAIGVRPMMGTPSDDVGRRPHHGRPVAISRSLACRGRIFGSNCSRLRT